MSAKKPEGPRSVALVGPYMSGKTTLLENILFVTEAVSRKGTAKDGNTVGDSAAEARERQMGTELNVATTQYLDDSFTFLDCPGSIELMQEMRDAVIGADAAVIVCEPDADRAQAIAPIMKMLEDMGLPRLIFVNKLDKATGQVQDVIDALQPVSAAPLVLRHLPHIENEAITGYVDLASERAYLYRPGKSSEIIEPPADIGDDTDVYRYQMLETLADFDDDLMEKVLEDETPERDEVYVNLTRDFQNGDIVPVLLGAAEQEEGVRRLLKTLRHEVPEARQAAERIGVEQAGGTLAQVLKTYHTPHAGKLSVARIWRGNLQDGDTLNDMRVSGIFSMLGHNHQKRDQAEAGMIVGLGRMDEAATGDILSDNKGTSDLLTADTLPPVFHMAVQAKKRDDEVKLTGALNRLTDEDRSLSFIHTEDTHELVLSGQGDIHLKIACDRLKNKYGLDVGTARPKVPYKEALRKTTQQHGRHKKQSGGHGQFGDVHIEIKPLPRGSGFQFQDAITGGVVPRQFIPAVEAGVREAMTRGALGFEVVDVAVKLYDGQHHSVDSSEIAFKLAGRSAMSEGMSKCGPVLLEPINKVSIHTPSEHTPKINAIVSGRRGQILGFDARDGWSGWDTVAAQMPLSEMADLIVELRSATQGTATFETEFDHLQELVGRLADQIVQARQEELAN